MNLLCREQGKIIKKMILLGGKGDPLCYFCMV